MQLSERIAKLERQLATGHITSDEFDSCVVAVVQDDSDKRKQEKESARFHVAITNNTTGIYRRGITDHYVNTGKEVDDLLDEWWVKNDLSAMNNVAVGSVQVSGGIKMIDGHPHVSMFVRHDRKPEQ